MGILEAVRSRGEQLIGQVSNELMSNPRFMRAMEAAWKGKERLDQAVARVLKTMNVPTRTEFKRALARLEAVEEELKSLRAERRGPSAAPAARRARRPRRKTPPAPPAGQVPGTPTE